MSETRVAPGQGQGEAFVWKPDMATPMRFFQMDQIRAANKARLEQAKQQEEDKARQALDKTLQEKGEYGWYQPLYSPFNKGFIEDYTATRDLPTAQKKMAYYKNELGNFDAYNKNLTTLVNADLADPELNNDAIAKYTALGVSGLSRPDKPIPPPEEVVAFYRDRDVYNRPQIGANIFKNQVDKITTETGNRAKSETIVRSRILDKEGGFREDVATTLIMGNPKAKKAFEVRVRDLMQEQAALNPTPGQMDYNTTAKKIQSQVVREFFPPETTGEYSKTQTFGPVGKSSKPSKPEAPISTMFVSYETPSFPRKVSGRTQDGKAIATQPTQADMQPINTVGYALVPENAKAAKNIAQSVISKGAKYYSVGVLEEKEIPAKAKKDIRQTFEDAKGKTISLNKKYAQGEPISNEDYQKLVKAKMEDLVTKPTKGSAIPEKRMLDIFANPTNVSVTKRARSKESFELDGVFYNKNDFLPPSVVSRLAPSFYEVELGVDVVPMQQQESKTTRYDADGNVTITETDKLTSPTTNQLGTIFIPINNAPALKSLVENELKKKNMTLDQLSDELSTQNGLPSAVKSRSANRFNAAPQTKKTNYFQGL